MPRWRFTLHVVTTPGETLEQTLDRVEAACLHRRSARLLPIEVGRRYAMRRDVPAVGWVQLVPITIEMATAADAFEELAMWFCDDASVLGLELAESGAQQSCPNFNG